MNVNLYTFAKKKNSTARPASNPTMYVCTLKEGCSVISPTIGLDLGRLTSPSSFNYAYISDFSRYYYIKDWYWENGLWWANLHVDVLSSYRTEILNTPAYILRASKSYNGNIIDNMYPALSTGTEYKFDWPTTSKTPWVTNFSGGFYIIGIINSDNNSLSPVSYYAFQRPQYEAFKSFLLSDTNWTDISSTNPDLGDVLYKSLFNPFQYIVSANWFPFSFDTTWGTLIQGIKFGWWTLPNLYCYQLDEYKHIMSGQLQSQEHPQASNRGIFLNTAPFTRYTLYAPPFGEFDLDGSIIINGTYNESIIRKYVNIYCKITVDFLSGDGLLQVEVEKSNERRIILQSLTKVAIPIQVNQISANIESSGNIMQMLGGAAITSFPVLFGDKSYGSIGGMVNGILNGAMSAVSQPKSIGSNGSLCTLQRDFCLVTRYFTVVDDDLADKGRPLCLTSALTNLYPGYVLTSMAHVSISGFEEEITTINNYLDGGVYLE